MIRASRGSFFIPINQSKKQIISSLSAFICLQIFIVSFHYAEMTIKPLKSDCTRGIMQRAYDINTLQTLSKAYVGANFHDNHFYGSFCPPTSGLYRLIYESSIQQNYETSYSSYTFNNITLKDRTSAYHYLFSKTCYNYRIVHSIDNSATAASLYFQKDSGEKQYVTSSTSYTCNRDICLPGSTDQRCKRFCTCRRNRRNENIILITFIHLIYIY